MGHSRLMRRSKATLARGPLDRKNILSARFNVNLALFQIGMVF
jgi:hypothetical protein